MVIFRWKILSLQAMITLLHCRRKGIENGPSSSPDRTPLPLKMGRAAVHAVLVQSLFLIIPLCRCLSIPASFDGFPYGGAADCGGSTVSIEAFFDPLCPDSREAWPPLQQALRHYSSRINLIVHPFPLPYHHNAFLSCRALHIANKLNASTTYRLMELFFEYQEIFYNAPTINMSRAAIIDEMSKLGAMAVGDSLLPAFHSGFEDPKTDRAARVSFNYGCSRGVMGTPFFFVNGFALPNPGYAVDYSTWRSILDPVMGEHSEELADSMFSF